MLSDYRNIKQRSASTIMPFSFTDKLRK